MCPEEWRGQQDCRAPGGLCRDSAALAREKPRAQQRAEAVAYVRAGSGASALGSPLLFAQQLSCGRGGGEGTGSLHTELLCFSGQDKQDIKQSSGPDLTSQAGCAANPPRAACPPVCSVGSSHPSGMPWPGMRDVLGAHPGGFLGAAAIFAAG